MLNTRGLSPRKSLNGSARAFTPKSGASSKHPRSLVSPSLDSRSSLSSSPTSVNFTFPAINSNYQYLPQNLKKDDQGFYTSVTSPSSPPRAQLESRLSSARLPHLLSDAQSRSRKASKTRVIVDQMKAVPVPSKKGRSRNHSERSSAGEVGNSPSSEGSVSSCDTGDTKNSNLTKGGNRGRDPDATRVSAGNGRKEELPSSPIKASFQSSTTAAGSSVKPAPDVSLMQSHVPPFYSMSHVPGYPYSYVLGGLPPPVTSWVAIPPPVYPSVVYTRPVMVHATW